MKLWFEKSGGMSVRIIFDDNCSLSLPCWKEKNDAGVSDDDDIPATAAWTRYCLSTRPPGTTTELRGRRIGQAASGMCDPSRPRRCAVAHCSRALWRWCPSSSDHLSAYHPSPLGHQQSTSLTTNLLSRLPPIHAQRRSFLPPNPATRSPQFSAQLNTELAKVLHSKLGILPERCSFWYAWLIPCSCNDFKLRSAPLDSSVQVSTWPPLRRQGYEVWRG